MRAPALPKALDWRSSKAVTPIRDQGNCGSCYAFAAVAAIESALIIAKKGNAATLDLSEQQLVDCTWNYYNLGCNGGIMDACFEYLTFMSLMPEASYPYVTRD